MNISRAKCTFVLMFFLATPVFGQLSTKLESEMAYSESQRALSKNDVILKLEWQQKLNNQVDFTVIPKARLSYDDALGNDTQSNTQRPSNYSSVNGPAYEDKNHRVELSEAYADIWMDEISLRLGKQQVVWGQSDGLKVLDVINPQSYREFNLAEFEVSRIPTWMANLQFPLGTDTTLQVLLIPDLTFNELADPDSNFTITSPELAPQPVSGVPVIMNQTKRPSNKVETGLRVSSFIHGWDVSANYFKYYQDTPVVYRNQLGSSVEVTPIYEESQLLGVSANTVVGNWVLKLESGYIDDQYFLRNDLTNSGVLASDEVAGVFAFDYHGMSERMISYQLFISHIIDYDAGLIRNENSIRHTLLFKQNLMHQTLELKWFALFNQDYEDGQSRFKVSYKVNDHWSIWSGVDYFYGDRQGPFGQFKDASRMTLGWQWAY